MAMGMVSGGWSALVDELKELEAFFPLLASGAEHEDVLEEIAELEDLIAAAGYPDDEHSLRALTFLENELAKKRSILARIL